MHEVRFMSVKKSFPNEADALLAATENMAKLRYASYIRKSKEDWSDATEA